MNYKIVYTDLFIEKQKIIKERFKNVWQWYDKSIPKGKRFSTKANEIRKRAC